MSETAKLAPELRDLLHDVLKAWSNDDRPAASALITAAAADTVAEASQALLGQALKDAYDELPQHARSMVALTELIRECRPDVEVSDAMLVHVRGLIGWTEGDLDVMRDALHSLSLETDEPVRALRDRFDGVLALRERLTGEFGSERARFLAWLVVGGRTALLQRLDDDPWLLSDECSQRVEALARDRSQPGIELLQELRRKLEFVAGRAPEVQEMLRRCEILLEALREQAEHVFTACSDSRSKLEALDHVSLAAMTADELPGFIQIIEGKKIANWSEFGAWWLVWRTVAQSADVEDSQKALLAGCIGEAMRTFVHEPGLPRARLKVLGFAVAHASRTPRPLSVARWYFLMARTLFTMTDAEFPDRLTRIPALAWRAQILAQIAEDERLQADALGLCVRALGMTASQRQDSLDDLANKVRESLAGLEAHETYARAVMLRELAILLTSASDVDADHYRESCTLLEEARTLFAECEVQGEANTVSLLLARMELHAHQHGVGGNLDRAMELLQAGMHEFARGSTQDFAHAIWLALPVLVASGRPLSVARDLVENALAHTQVLAPHWRALLLAWRAFLWLHTDDSHTRPPAERGEAVLPYLEEAWTLVVHGSAEHIIEVAKNAIDVHETLGQPDEALAALDRARELLGDAPLPDSEAWLLSQEMTLLLQRAQGRDVRRAERCLTRLLELASRHPDETRADAVLATMRWTRRACTARKTDYGQYTHALVEPVRALADTLDGIKRSELDLLVQALESRRADDQRAMERVAEALLDWAREQRSLSWHNTAWLFAVAALGSEHACSQAAGRAAEPLALASSSPEMVYELADLALLRLHAPPHDPPRREHGSVALQLIEHASTLRQTTVVPGASHRRLAAIERWARIRILCATPGQDSTKLATRAREIGEACMPMHHVIDHGALRELCMWLRTYACSEPQPLRTLAAEIEQRAQLDDNESRQDLWTRFTDGVDTADPVSQLEQAAELCNTGVFRLAESIIAQAEALLPEAQDEEHAQLLRVLAIGWLRHPAQDRAKAQQRAVDYFEHAREAWPDDDARTLFEMIQQQTEALRSLAMIERAPEHLARARNLLDQALADPRSADYPRELTFLLYQRGLMDMSDRSQPFGETQSVQTARGWLSRALDACPADMPDVRASVLITLGNSERALGISTKDAAMLDSAIQRYRESLALQNGAKLAHFLEEARCRKCLGDALLGRVEIGGDPALLDEAATHVERAAELRKPAEHTLLHVETLHSLTRVRLAQHEHGHGEALARAHQSARRALDLCAPTLDPTLQAILVSMRTHIENLMAQDGPADSLIEPLSPKQISGAREYLHGMPPLRSLSPHLDAASWRDYRSGKFTRDAIGRMFLRCIEHMDAVHRDDILERCLRRLDAVARKRSKSRLRQKDIERLVIALMLPKNDRPDPRVLATARAFIASRRLRAVPWTLRAMLLDSYGMAATSDTGGNPAEVDWEGAEKALRQALALAREHTPEHWFLVDCIGNLARTLYHMPGPGKRERWNEARALYEEGIAMARRKGHRGAHSMMLNAAVLLSDMGHEEPSLKLEAIRMYDALAEMAERSPPSASDEVLLRTNRAWARIQLGHEHQPQASRDALPDLDQAESIARKYPELHDEIGVILNFRGTAYSLIYRHDQHEDDMQRSMDALHASMDFWRKHDNPREWAHAAHNLGNLYRNSRVPEHHVEGMRWLMQAFAHRPELAVEQWTSLQDLADSLLFHAHRMPEEVAYELASEFAPRLEHVAWLLGEEGHTVRACEALGRVIELHGLFGHRDPDWLDACIAKAETWWQSARSRESLLVHARHLGRLCGRRAVWAAQARESPLAVLHHAARGQGRALMVERDARGATWDPRLFIERTTLLHGVQAARRATDAAALPAALGAEAQLRALDQQHLASLHAHRPALDHDALRRALAGQPHTALLDISIAPEGSAMVRAYLDPRDELMLESSTTDLTSHEVGSWLHRPDQRGLLDVLAPDHDLDGLSWAERIHACMMPVLGKLWDRLLATAVRGLRAAGIRHLVFVLNGPIVALPLAAAWRHERGTITHLIEDFTSVRIVPSVELFVHGHAPGTTPKQATAAIVASDPRGDFHVTSNGQPDTNLQQFVDSVVMAMESSDMSTSVVGSVGRQPVIDGALRATPSSVRMLLNDTDIVHFMCHGVMHPWSDELSGLCLDDGKLLSAAELLALSHPMRSKLIVMGACRSAETRPVDEGSEWASISGAFLRAGAEAVIGALWSVFYAHTDRFLRIFYRRLSQDAAVHIALGDAMRQALDRARSQRAHPTTTPMEQREQRIAASPMYWAAFQLLAIS